MNSAATSKSTRKSATAKGKVVSKRAKSVAQPQKKGKSLSPAAKAAAKAAIPVMADTGAKLSKKSEDGMPIKLSRRNTGYSDTSHRTKDRIPLQVSLPPLLVAEMKRVKLLQGVSMVDQIIHCMEMAGYTVDEQAKTAMAKRYVAD